MVSRRLAGLLVVVVLLLLGSGTIARGQAADAEDGFVARVAQERSSRGLGRLAFAEDLQVVARRHAQRMADRGEPYHNPDLGSEVQGWEVAAENVGVGPDVDTTHRAFMDSPEHRDIILHPDLTELGVGVVRTSDGREWVVEVFRRPAQATASPTTTTTVSTTVTTSAPARPPTTSGAGPAVAPPTTGATTTTMTSPTPDPAATSALPRAEADQDAVATSGARPAALARSAIETASPVVIDPDLAGLARSAPPAAWVAAFLLAGVVGLQGQTLRRLGLVA